MIPAKLAACNGAVTLPIERIYPRDISLSSKDCFNLLLLGQGFTRSEFANICKHAWDDAISQIPPLNEFKSKGRYLIAVYCDSATDATGIKPSLDLKLVQQDNKLSLPINNSSALYSYLYGLKIRETNENALDVWGTNRLFGLNGSLIAVLKKRTTMAGTSAELYEMVSSENYPIPFVGVVVTGNYWHMPIVRGIAQRFAGLANEYEVSGEEYGREVTEGMAYPPPNVIFIDDTQRKRLIAGENPLVVVETPARRFAGLAQWPISYNTLNLKFYQKTDDIPNSDIRKQNGLVQFVEGGNGYRRYALRCDFDCIMRRMANSANLPIQASIDFCAVCRNVLRSLIRGQTPIPSGFGRTLLNNQLLLYDKVGWKYTDKIDLGQSNSYSSIVTSTEKRTSKPKWEFNVELKPSQGFKITDIKLKDRPSDPFRAAEQIMKEISFKDLEIRFASEPAALQLSLQQALDKSADVYDNDDPPKLYISKESGRNNDFQIGIKLSLSWRLARQKCSVKAEISFVVKGDNNDFDPGGAAYACKFYPQLSMRYRRLSKIGKGGLPKVHWLKGTVSMTISTVIPTTMAGNLHPALRDMATGKQVIGLVTDSNSSDRDNQYDLKPVGPLPNAPPWGFWSGKWKSGRKLASVVEFQLLSPIITLPGATALYADKNAGKPTLPHWSWLFDYCLPAVNGKKEFVGVYKKGEETARGDDGGLPREERKLPWPETSHQTNTPKRSYIPTIRKVARQGAYDNLHVSAYHGLDHHGFHLSPAPFCADVCMHLHWRWGTVATSAANNMQIFLGWGTGKLDQGANTILGAPLIPPNQHLGLKVTKRNDSEGVVDYVVTVYEPGIGERQVFLEQGLGLAFNYNGLSKDDLVQLAAALGVKEVVEKLGPLTGPLSVAKELKSKPAVDADRITRSYFHEIYEAIRWYNPSIDETISNVQQLHAIPDPTDSKNLLVPSSLEDL
jgi:hypothetical protein